eukprot:1240764-Rhodomonas_salina.1
MNTQRKGVLDTFKQPLNFLRADTPGHVHGQHLTRFCPVWGRFQPLRQILMRISRRLPVKF